MEKEEDDKEGKGREEGGGRGRGGGKGPSVDWGAFSFLQDLVQFLSSLSRARSSCETRGRGG